MERKVELYSNLNPLKKRAKQLKNRLGITHTEALNRIASIEGYESWQNLVKEAYNHTPQTNFDYSRKLEFLEEVTTFIVEKLYPGEDIEVEQNGEYYLREDIKDVWQQIYDGLETMLFQE